MRRQTTPSILLLLVLGCPPAPGDTTADATTGDASTTTTDALSTYGASETSVFESTSAPVDRTTTDPTTSASATTDHATTAYETTDAATDTGDTSTSDDTSTGDGATSDAYTSASTSETTTGEAICDGLPGTVFGPCIDDACAPGLFCIMGSIGNVCAEACDNVGCPSECDGSSCGPTGACLLFCDDIAACPVGMTCDNPFCVWPV